MKHKNIYLNIIGLDYLNIIGLDLHLFDDAKIKYTYIYIVLHKLKKKKQKTISNIQIYFNYIVFFQGIHVSVLTLRLIILFLLFSHIIMMESLT